MNPTAVSVVGRSRLDELLSTFGANYVEWGRFNTDDWLGGTDNVPDRFFENDRTDALWPDEQDDDQPYFGANKIAGTYTGGLGLEFDTGVSASEIAYQIQSEIESKDGLIEDIEYDLELRILHTDGYVDTRVLASGSVNRSEPYQFRVGESVSGAVDVDYIAPIQEVRAAMKVTRTADPIRDNLVYFPDVQFELPDYTGEYDVDNIPEKFRRYFGYSNGSYIAGYSANNPADDVFAVGTPLDSVTTPVMENGDIYFSDSGSQIKIESHDMESGAQEWDVDYNFDGAKSQPLIQDGVIFVVSPDDNDPVYHHVQRWSNKNLDTAFGYRMSVPEDHQMAILNDNLLLSIADSDSSDEEIWALGTSGLNKNNTVVHDGLSKYIIAYDGVVYTTHSNSSKVVTTYDGVSLNQIDTYTASSSNNSTGVAIYQSTVYAPADDGMVYALTDDELYEKWSVQTDASGEPSPPTVGGREVVTAFDGDSVVAVDVMDGSISWRTTLDVAPEPVSIKGSKVGVTTHNGEFVQLSLYTGDVLSRTQYGVDTIRQPSFTGADGASAQNKPGRLGTNEYVPSWASDRRGFKRYVLYGGYPNPASDGVPEESYNAVAWEDGGSMSFADGDGVAFKRGI
jgi:translation elongation factor P/translation initiation factor 5A